MRLLFFLISLCFMTFIGANNSCTCSQLFEQIQCLESPKCTWINSKCILNAAFVSNDSKEFLCSNYPQKECRLLRECVFHLGECQKFTDCQMLIRNSCEQSSNYCIPDGRKCVNKSDCQSYITQIACQSRNLKNQYCFWNKSQCESIQTCDKLPKSLKTDKQCRAEISHCTVAINGGCMDSPYLCEQHETQSQCYTNYDQKIQCFWDGSQNQCFERICKNAIFKTQVECQTINQNCTSDGTQCIELSDCSNYKTKIGCQYDKAGNACTFVNEECTMKSCATAPQQLALFEQCRDYFQGKECVPTLNGGCKDFPVTCLEFETSDSCLILRDKTECFWENNQCKIKECTDAPLDYQYKDCLKWMVNCIGSKQGGCTVRPSECEEIEDPQSCDYDQNKNKCFYETMENQCKTLNCSSLKLPLYSNHSQCQAKLATCTFSSSIGGCLEFTCANIEDQDSCIKDYNGFPCQIQDCSTKTCSNAHKSLNNHQQCEQWNSDCTVRKQGYGCESKFGLCNEYAETQCYSTLNDSKCIWKDLQCQDSLCTDAPSSSYNSHELCLNQWKVKIGKCTLANSGLGCQIWPSTCTTIFESSLCLIGTETGESCSWFSGSCEVKNCSNAPDNYKSITQCSKWLPNCTFSNSFCVDQITIQCNSMNSFTTHSECNEWNSNCTIAPRILEQGCEEKRLCSEYKQESQCKIGSDGSTCQWNSMNLSCSNAISISCDQIVSKDWSRKSCESQNTVCTISEISYSCINRITQCSQAAILQECLKASANQQNCYWNTISDSCEDSLCEQNTTASTGYECLQYSQKRLCQLKLNSDGTYDRGCETIPTICNAITEEQKCNKSYLPSGTSCYFISGTCISTTTANCNQFTLATTNEECQRLQSSCQLHPLGTGCVNTSGCSSIQSDACNLVELINHETCHFEPDISSCISNDNAPLFNYESTCINGHDTRKRKLKWVSNDCQDRQCNDSIPNATSNENCKEYQSFCRFNGTNGCMINNTCQDISDSTICDTATDGNKNFCAWDPATTTCLSNELCENQKTATGVNKDRICHDWQYFLSTRTCVANPLGDGCILMQSCDQIKIYIQCKYVSSCYWVHGLKCQDSPMCHANKTAISQFECRQYNPFCNLNWNAGSGCNYTECSKVAISQCNSIVLNDGTFCYINATSQCITFACTSLFVESDCIAIRSNGSKCYWNGTNCNTYPCDQISNVFSDDDCSAYNKDCQIKLLSIGPSLCKDKTICSDYTSQSSCQIDINGLICYWSGTLCDNALSQCIDYVDPTICNYSKQLDGQSCFWSSSCEIKTCQNVNIISPNTKSCHDWSNCPYDPVTQTCLDCNTNPSNICLQHTCSNYNGAIFNLDSCQDWLSSCTVNPLQTECIDKVDCKQAPKAYTTHSQCQSYLSQCTVARNQPTCVPLPSNCNEATDIQCNLDASGNKCYWSDQMNICITLISCDQISLTLSVHSDCNSLLASCTVNQNLQGCCSLQNCTDYSQDQCYISIDNKECSWFDSQCQEKSCLTADLIEYTNIDCRAYFNSTCSLNEIGSRCIESPKTCGEYTQFQCSSPDSQNFYGIPCIETISGGCIERECGNSLLILSSITQQNCQFISPTCNVDGCRNKECSDIQSNSEEICQNALPKTIKCSSSPYGCVDRAQCQDALTSSACNFDDKGQQCEWINGSCSSKSCQTAPMNLKSTIECNAYLSGCIPKRLGGCMERSSCSNIQVEEECNFDNENVECNWDYDLEICQYQQCQPECGDGIVSRGFEDCDDGNTLPYDGCYQCQFQCNLGCETCIGSLCQECQIGWVLKEKCETVCGDGLVFGTEECDDMNQLPYDGCFECKFQCHRQCKVCEQGNCFECHQGWYLDNQQCVTHCGDGLVVLELEQCDDYNQQDKDGCDSTCQIEIGWTCKSNPQGCSECIRISIPQLYLSLITLLNQPIQQVDLSFSEAMRYKSRINQSLAQALAITILDSNPTQKIDISIEILQEPTEQLQLIIIRIFIQFYEYQPSPVLNVTLQNVLVNQYDAELQSLYQTIHLSTPYIISETTIKITQKVTLFNEILLYILLSIAVIALLSGKIQIFWNLIDTLQVLSYLRYINIQFPETLEIYFYLFSHLNIQPLIELMRLDEIYTVGQKKDKIFIQPSGKMQTENNNSGETLINAFFLINIQSVVLVLVFGYVGYYASYLILKYANPIRLDNYLQLKSWPKIDKIRYINLKIMGVIYKQCMRSIKHFYYSGILCLLQSSVYKIAFASFLQLVHPKNDTNLFIISYFTSGIVLLSLIYFVGYVFSKSMSQYKDRQFSELNEGISHQHKWSKQYYTLLTIKKITFMLIIICCQDLEAVQSGLISMVSLAFLAYMHNSQPLINKFEQRKIMFTELIISINTLLFTFYQVFHYQIIFQILPLLNIALFSSILTFQLILDIYEHKNNIANFTKDLIKK